jgi:hypothetical protein
MICGIAVKDALRDQPQQMQPGFHAKAEHRAVQPGFQHRADHAVGRGGGVDVERMPHIGQRAKDRVELRRIEIFAMGVAVHQHALEADCAPRRISAALHCGSCGAIAVMPT